MIFRTALSTLNDEWIDSVANHPSSPSFLLESTVGVGTVYRCPSLESWAFKAACSLHKSVEPRMRASWNASAGFLAPFGLFQESCDGWSIIAIESLIEISKTHGRRLLGCFLLHGNGKGQGFPSPNTKERVVSTWLVGKKTKGLLVPNTRPKLLPLFFPNCLFPSFDSSFKCLFWTNLVCNFDMDTCSLPLVFWLSFWAKLFQFINEPIDYELRPPWIWTDCRVG